MVDFHNLNEDEVKVKLLHKAELLKNRKDRPFTSNFGMIASLGGVIIVPMVICITLGGYLDEILPQRFSWRLSLLFLGFIWGIANAYWWIKNENNKLNKNDMEYKDRKVKDGE